MRTHWETTTWFGSIHLKSVKSYFWNTFSRFFLSTMDSVPPFIEQPFPYDFSATQPFCNADKPFALHSVLFSFETWVKPKFVLFLVLLVHCAAITPAMADWIVPWRWGKRGCIRSDAHVMIKISAIDLFVCCNKAVVLYAFIKGMRLIWTKQGKFRS